MLNTLFKNFKMHIQQVWNKTSEFVKLFFSISFSFKIFLKLYKLLNIGDGIELLYDQAEAQYLQFQVRWWHKLNLNLKPMQTHPRNTFLQKGQPGSILTGTEQIQKLESNYSDEQLEALDEMKFAGFVPKDTTKPRIRNYFSMDQLVGE
jgi:hypothetical protein